MDESQDMKSAKKEPLLDREDWLYIAAIFLIGSGAALILPSAGLICVGVLLLWWPIMARLCAARRDSR